MFCTIVAEFLRTSASRGHSAIVEPLLFTKIDYIKSGQRDDKSPLKGAWFCSCDPFFACTAVELEWNLRCTRWFAINRLLDVGCWVSHLRRSTLVRHAL